MELIEKNFNTLYKKLVKYVLKNGTNVTVRNKKTIEWINCAITLTDINRDKIDFNSTLAYRRQKKYEKYKTEEIKWYESGCLVAKHAPAAFWETIAGTDGKIQSNYGFLILHEKKPYNSNGITPYKQVLKILKNDKLSRQAIFHYNLPYHYSINSKDIPCTISTQVLVRQDKLHFLVYQRSSDLYKGLPYDVAWHCYLMKKMATDLTKIGYKVIPGKLTLFIGSVHIYSENIPFMKKFLAKRRKSHAKAK